MTLFSHNRSCCTFIFLFAEKGGDAATIRAKKIVNFGNTNQSKNHHFIVIYKKESYVKHSRSHYKKTYSSLMELWELCCNVNFSEEDFRGERFKIFRIR
jgi:hypothetical protein